MIYLDNAATTIKKPEAVIKAVTEALSAAGNSGRGVHSASLDASRIVYDTRVQLSSLFGADNPDRIAFTMNATEALNIAIQGIFNPGDHVITTALEHNSVLRPLYMMEEKGVEITIIPTDEKGNICYEDIKRDIKDNTKAVVCTHASNLTGNILDIEKIGKIAKDNDLMFIVDASQTAGFLDIDVKRMNIDVLCFTGHKSLMGPQGTGGLYVREGVEIRPLLSGGSGVLTYSKSHPGDMPVKLEAGTLNVHGIAGLNASVKYIREKGLENIRKAELELADYFYREVFEIPGVKVYGDFSESLRCPIVSLNIRDYDSSKVADVIYSQYGIATRAGAHCAPLMHKALGTVEQGAVRFSFSYFNTIEEAALVVKAVKEVAE